MKTSCIQNPGKSQTDLTKDENENGKSEGEKSGAKVTVDRCLSKDFLWKDMKHDVWLEMKKTKEEIKELEKTTKETKQRKLHAGKKVEEQNLSKMN